MASSAPASSATSREDADERIYRKVFRRIVPFLMVCYIISYLDRVNVAFAKLQMQQDRGFSETVFGFGAGIFFLGYFIFGLPSNLLMVRVGARRWLASILIVWSLFSASFIFIGTPASYFTMRFLLGVAEAGFYPGAILYLTYWFPSHRRAAIIALFMSAIPAAGVFGNPLSGWIMSSFNGSTGLRGWQWMFVIEALPALMAGITAFFVLDDSIADARWLNADEKKFLADEIAADAGNRGASHPAREIFRDWRVWKLCLIYFAIVMAQYGLTFWMPTLIKATGIQSSMKIGFLAAVPFLCAIVAMNLCGRSSDAKLERRWHLIVPAIVSALGFVVSATYPGSISISLVFLSLAAAGVLTATSQFWALPTALLSGTAAAAGIAVINSVGNLAGFLSPSLIGYLKDATHKNEYGMYALALILVACAISVLRIPAKLVNR